MPNNEYPINPELNRPSEIPCTLALLLGMAKLLKSDTPTPFIDVFANSFQNPSKLTLLLATIVVLANLLPVPLKSVPDDPDKPNCDAAEDSPSNAFNGDPDIAKLL